jgi:hypothetical protein
MLAKIMGIALALLLSLGSGLPAVAKYRPGQNKARQQFLRRVMTDPKQPRFVRGALRNQVRSWRSAGKKGSVRLRNPKGYDVGHHPMKRGSVNPDDLRLEVSRDNRSRPQRAKGRARKRGGRANYY